MPETYLIVGATSAIAQAVCHQLAERGNQLILAGRDAEALAIAAKDLTIRYSVQVATEAFDAAAFDSYAALFQRSCERFEGGLAGVVCFQGYLPERQTDPRELRQAIDVNLTSVALLTNLAADYFEKLRRGQIVVVSSVAGDRGRQSNYVYGAAKGGLSIYLAGLTNRLWRSGVHVLTVKPGFVDTPMTQGKLNPNSKLVATPERVAKDIVKAMQKRKTVLYTPWFWWPIMTIICTIPGRIFNRLRL